MKPVQNCTVMEHFARFYVFQCYISDILSGDIRETEDPDVRTIKTIYKLCMEQKQSTVAQGIT